MTEPQLLTLLPVVLTIACALLLRRTLVALTVGLISSALLLYPWQPFEASGYLLTSFIEQVYKGGQWQVWHLDVLASIVLLGILTSVLAHSGAVAQFAAWLFPKITTVRGARLAVVGLGFFIFIDGIFSALANGNVSRPLSQRYKISSSQLAYLVDSTASPLCALLPFSSWGPYVMALLGGITALTVTPLHAFLTVASFNFYAIATLLLAFVVAYSSLGFVSEQAEFSDAQNEQSDASPWALGGPLLVLLLGSLGLMLYSGAQNSQEIGVLAWLSSADVGMAMRMACLAAVIVALIGAKLSGNDLAQLVQAVLAGLRSVLLALGILWLTWMIGKAIADLGSGKILAELVSAHLSHNLLLPGLFLLCAVMAFATGTSWGTFALMIPLGAEIALAVSPNMLLPAMAAVMSGSVFGDHCSPISDTTVLSATSSGCSPSEHVTTQLPLASIAAVVSLIGFSAVSFKIEIYWVYLALISGFALLTLYKLRSNENCLA